MVTYNQVKGTFGFSDTDSIGKSSFPAATVDVFFFTRGRYLHEVHGEKKSAEFRTSGLKLISIYIS